MTTTPGTRNASPPCRGWLVGGNRRPGAALRRVGPRRRSGPAKWSSVPRRSISASSPAAPRPSIASSSRTFTKKPPTSSRSRRVASARSRRSASDSLKTWEKTEIVVTLDTRAEPGRKDGTIEVEFDLPFPAKLQLHVHSFIRGDVVVQPGVVEFGSVNQGAGASRELKITYAGRNDWKIAKVECANPIHQSPRRRNQPRAGPSRARSPTVSRWN